MNYLVTVFLALGLANLQARSSANHMQRHILLFPADVFPEEAFLNLPLSQVVSGEDRGDPHNGSTYRSRMLEFAENGVAFFCSRRIQNDGVDNIISDACAMELSKENWAVLNQHTDINLSLREPVKNKIIWQVLGQKARTMPLSGEFGSDAFERHFEKRFLTIDCVELNSSIQCFVKLSRLR